MSYSQSHRRKVIRETIGRSTNSWWNGPVSIRVTKQELHVHMAAVWKSMLDETKGSGPYIGFDVINIPETGMDQ